jgi:TetR/AcrR family transcriptional repressor of nem operon
MPRIKKFDKEKVLEAASSVFQNNGYNGASIDELLTATGLSRSSLYDTFTDKHNLYIQSLEFYKNKNSAQIKNINNNNNNGLEKIETLFNRVVSHLKNNPNDNGCLLVNAAAEMSKQCFKTAQVICNDKIEIQSIFNEWITDAQKEKLISNDKAVESYSQFLYNALCGLRVLSQSGASEKELYNVVKITLKIFN